MGKAINARLQKSWWEADYKVGESKDEGKWTSEAV